MIAPVKLLLQVLIISLMVSACAPTTTTTDVTPTDEPFYAWDFTMDSLDGQRYTLSDLRGQFVLINFWATWCVPCREEMPELQFIADSYADELILLGINNRESAERVQSFADELAVTFPLLLNPPDDVLLNYQVLNLPQTVLINPDGELVWRQFGALNADDFDDVIAALR